MVKCGGGGFMFSVIGFIIVVDPVFFRRLLAGGTITVVNCIVNVIKSSGCRPITTRLFSNCVELPGDAPAGASKATSMREGEKKAANSSGIRSEPANDDQSEAGAENPASFGSAIPEICQREVLARNSNSRS
jgi:hypothetical protein